MTTNPDFVYGAATEANQKAPTAPTVRTVSDALSRSIEKTSGIGRRVDFLLDISSPEPEVPSSLRDQAEYLADRLAVIEEQVSALGERLGGVV